MSCEEIKSSSNDNGSPEDASSRKAKRGYSSGGSSEGLGGDSSTTSRRSVDVLRLKSMRNVLHANGDLTQAVVRLEVRTKKNFADWKEVLFHVSTNPCGVSTKGGIC